MYIQITTRCNMSCPHCCYNCTKDGVDMPLSTFLKALDLCIEKEESIFLGGGEPTIHPRFERILLEAISANSTVYDGGLGPVGIITNGSIRRRAKMLYNLHKQGIVWAALSLDDYHDAIDADIMHIFQKKGMIHDTSSKGSRNPLPHGRARDLLGLDEDEDHATEYGCPCADWMIQPDGLIRQCGCEDSPIVGNVHDGIDSPVGGTCHLSHEFVREYETA